MNLNEDFFFTNVRFEKLLKKHFTLGTGASDISPVALRRGDGGEVLAH